MNSILSAFFVLGSCGQIEYGGDDLVGVSGSKTVSIVLQVLEKQSAYYILRHKEIIFIEKLNCADLLRSIEFIFTMLKS